MQLPHSFCRSSSTKYSSINTNLRSIPNGILCTSSSVKGMTAHMLAPDVDLTTYDQ